LRRLSGGPGAALGDGYLSALGSWIKDKFFRIARIDFNRQGFADLRLHVGEAADDNFGAGLVRRPELRGNRDVVAHQGIVVDGCSGVRDGTDRGSAGNAVLPDASVRTPDPQTVEGKEEEDNDHDGNRKQKRNLSAKLVDEMRFAGVSDHLGCSGFAFGSDGVRRQAGLWKDGGSSGKERGALHAVGPCGMRFGRGLCGRDVPLDQMIVVDGGDLRGVCTKDEDEVGRICCFDEGAGLVEGMVSMEAMERFGLGGIEGQAQRGAADGTQRRLQVVAAFEPVGVTAGLGGQLGLIEAHEGGDVVLRDERAGIDGRLRQGGRDGEQQQG
jgi:hypothetical protein